MSLLAIRHHLLPLLALGHLNCGTAATPTSEPIVHPETSVRADDEKKDRPPTKAAEPMPLVPPSEQLLDAPPGFAFGKYTQLHVAFEQCDSPEMCETEVEDTLTIAEASDGAVDVKIEVMQDNGHSCSFSGILAEIAPRHWGWSDETQTCQIALRLEDDSFALTSDGCRETYCGARAHLQGSFSLSGLGSAP